MLKNNSEKGHLETNSSDTNKSKQLTNLKKEQLGVDSSEKGIPKRAILKRTHLKTDNSEREHLKKDNSETETL